MNEDNRDRFLTINEIAEQARVSPSMIRKLIREGKLASVRYGTLHRIPARNAEVFLRQGAAARQLRDDIADEFREAARVR